MNEKIIISIHAEKENKEYTLDTAYSGSNDEIVALLANAILGDDKLKMILSRALYVADVADVQIEDEIPDLVDIFEGNSNVRH